MLSNIPPASVVTVAVVFACASGLVAHYIAAPLPDTSASIAFAPAPAHASPPFIVPDPPLLTDSALSNEPSLSSSDEGADHGILLVRQCLTLAERNPLAAMEMAAANQLHEIDSGLATSLIAQWAAQDFDHAYEWIKTQEPGAWREDMLARLAYLRAQADPIAAARLVATDMSAGRARDEAVISVVHQWALKDTRGAGLWAQSLPDETLRQRASAEVAALAASSAAIPIR
jgi:hypothetical protein